MHSEHIRNLHPGWVLGGWLLAVAVASVVFMVLVGIGLVGSEGRWTTVWALVAVALGFFAGGLFVGLRWSDAPILHGAAITLLSVLIWFLGSLIAPETLGGTGSGPERPPRVLRPPLLQLVASVAAGGARRGVGVHGATPQLAG